MPSPTRPGEDRERHGRRDEHRHVRRAGELEARGHDDADDRDDRHRQRGAAELADDAGRVLGGRVGHRPTLAARAAPCQFAGDPRMISAMSLRHHEIAEANHRILNPFTEPKLRLLGEVSGVVAGTRVLDLACGKGEMLCRWAEWFGSGGARRRPQPRVPGRGRRTGRGARRRRSRDVRPGRRRDLRARAGRLRHRARASARRGSAAASPARSSCCGRPSGAAGACSSASRTGSSRRRTRRSRRSGSRPTSSCPSRARSTGSRRRARSSSRWSSPTATAGTATRRPSGGTIAAWLAANPADPDHDAMRAFLDDGRRTYLRWGRRYLGWGVFVTRPR